MDSLGHILQTPMGTRPRLPAREYVWNTEQRIVCECECSNAMNK